MSARLWTWLTSPDGRIPADERRSAQLVAGLLLVLVTAGLASGLVQLAVIPNFWPTFLGILAALVPLTGAYALSRTSAWKVAAIIAAVAPIVASAVVAIENPHDRVWFAFAMVGPMLATTFLSPRVAAGIGLLALATIGAVVGIKSELHDPRQFVPPLAFHAVFTPLLLLGAIHRERVAREREEVLRASEQRCATLVADSPDAIATFGKDGQLLECNPATERIVGLPRAEILGRTWTELGLSVADAARVVQLDGGKEPALVVVELARQDGRRVWVESHGRFVTRETGASIELSMRDVSDRVRMQAERDELARQLEQARRLETLGRLAGGVAHDFNNLLTVILSTAELLKRSHPHDARLDDIVSASDRASALTSSLLAFARRRPMARVVVGVDDIIRGLERILRNLAGLKIELDIALGAEAGSVLADPTQLEQVIINLVTNARDAMSDGGKVRIATRTTIANGSPVVELVVSDNGQGMDRETAERAFEPFFTTKPTGTGLGLATAYGIVTQLGGKIRLDSHPGRGTTFFVELLRTAATNDTTAPPRLTPRVIGRTQILLVEDEPAVRRAIAELLKVAGYDVVAAGTSDEAIRIHHEHRATIGLVLSDVRLPGTSGPQIVARIARPELPVLYMSGYTADELGDLGTARLITKPFTSEQLVEAIDTMLREQATAASSTST